MPTSLAAVRNPADDPKAPKLFVTELRGTIKVIANDGSVSEFAKVPTFAPKVDWPDLEGEAGMAGICLDPEHGYVFVTYARRDQSGIMRNAITRFSATPGTLQGAAHAQQEIGQFLATEPSSYSHQIGNCTVHGGQLYVSVGDAGNPQLSPKLESPLGKVLRLTFDGAAVADNPFATGSQAAPRVFAYGLRNPFGLTFAGDRLFVAENGVEIDRFLEVARGRDYHWDGTDASIATNAAVVFVPTIGPVQTIYVPSNAAGGLAPADHDRFLIAASDGRQGPGIIVVDYDLANNAVLRAPHHLVRYEGGQDGVAVTGVASTKDGTCFVPIMPVGGAGVVLVTRYQPQAAHARIIGKSAGTGQLLASSGCLGCHERGGVGAHVGPALDYNSLRTRIETRVLNSGYAAQVAKLDALTDEAIVLGHAARQKVLSASPETRVHAWVVQRLLNPKFDMPDAQMPNLNFTPEKAEALATELLGPNAPSKEVEVLESKRFLGGVAVGGLGVGLFGALLLAIRPRLRRAKQAAVSTTPAT